MYNYTQLVQDSGAQCLLFSSFHMICCRIIVRSWALNRLCAIIARHGQTLCSAVVHTVRQIPGCAASHTGLYV